MAAAQPAQTGTELEGIVIEEAKVVSVRADYGWGRELQWVQIRNRSRETVDLSVSDLRLGINPSLAPHGMQLVEGSFRLDPLEAALIVTSPYVELDRGVAVEWRNVYVALDESRSSQVYDTDIGLIELVAVGGEVLADFEGPCPWGCCCDGDDSTCLNLFYDETCQTACNGGCFGPCQQWTPGECPPNAPNYCCQ